VIDDLESWLDFRANESRADRPLACCECGKEAEGNVSCDDGPICDACHATEPVSIYVAPQTRPR